ncbi:hypothetical protein ACE38W_13000 [Chitinophaga sp. Hz27]|uniref:hypothetical protein n=1 Tax=Chitinophaga sp. Hz27 TaxID=3347169 RepID=UPI0035D89C10
MPSNLSQLQIDVSKSMQTPIGLLQFLCSGMLIILGIASFIFSGLDYIIDQDYRILLKMLIVYLGLLLFVNKISQIILTRHKPGAVVQGQEGYEYSAGWRGFAQIGRYIFLSGLIFFIGTAVFIHQRQSSNSPIPTKQKGILVMNFSNQERDEFSDSLFDSLSPTVYGLDVKIEHPGYFLPVSSRLNPGKDIKPLLQNYKSGMVIFGSRNQKGCSFICNIFLHNVGVDCTNILQKDIVVAIRNPSLIELNDTSIQEGHIRKFVQALSVMFQCQDQIALNLFSSLIAKNNFQKESQILSYSHFFMGNIFFRHNQLSSAKQYYEMALKYDSSIAELKANYALLMKHYDTTDLTLDRTRQQAGNDTVNNPEDVRILYSKNISPYIVGGEMFFEEKKGIPFPTDFTVYTQFNAYDRLLDPFISRYCKVHLRAADRKVVRKGTAKWIVKPDYYYWIGFDQEIDSQGGYRWVVTQRGITKDDWAKFGWLDFMFEEPKGKPSGDKNKEWPDIDVRVVLKFSDSSIIEMDKQNIHFLGSNSSYVNSSDPK